jgi:hypothetical protein
MVLVLLHGAVAVAGVLQPSAASFTWRGIVVCLVNLLGKRAIFTNLSVTSRL